jgi:hypothetical protein
MTFIFYPFCSEITSSAGERRLRNDISGLLPICFSTGVHVAVYQLNYVKLLLLRHYFGSGFPYLAVGDSLLFSKVYPLYTFIYFFSIIWSAMVEEAAVRKSTKNLSKCLMEVKKCWLKREC